MLKEILKRIVRTDLIRVSGLLVLVLSHSHSHSPALASDISTGCQSPGWQNISKQNLNGQNLNGQNLNGQNLNSQNIAMPNVFCGVTPSTAIDGDGRLWVTFFYEGHVYLSLSEDTGKSFNAPVKVNAVAEEIYSNGENRPKIAFGAHGEIYISWIKKTGQRFSGDVRFSRSLDGGKYFQETLTVNDDGLVTSHRFQSIQVDSLGSIYLVWIDKRDLVAARSSNQPYTGAAIYFSVSTDHGKSFQKNRKVADYSCECCRIAISETSQGAAIFWRHIYAENTRDHAFAVLSKDGVIRAAQRATWDNWKIDGCPHHGPAMAGDIADVDNDSYHLAWFTGGEKNQGIYYGKYLTEESRVINLRAMSTSPTASHPHIQVSGSYLWLVWKEFDGQQTKVQLRASEDSGESWQPAKTIASTDSASDHPFLLGSSKKLYLSWHTKAEGLRIIALQDNKKARVNQ